MSRPSRRTLPLSGRRWPVIRLNSVDLPAPFGPITAAICRVATVRLTPETARNPPNDLERPETSSMALLIGAGFVPAGTAQAAPQRDEAADDAAGQAEQQHQQDRAEHERPILGV